MKIEFGTAWLTVRMSQLMNIVLYTFYLLYTRGCQPVVRVTTHLACATS